MFKKIDVFDPNAFEVGKAVRVIKLVNGVKVTFDMIVTKTSYLEIVGYKYVESKGKSDVEKVKIHIDDIKEMKYDLLQLVENK
jgi:hypothetical protein